ncbi:hypothetical protein PVK06_047135 [Gossypium arboreum]|uniref:Uncharacterized protein n=1 Tax=Gossypium arboreum TaxID=29729 RepID=A0ABR0MCZ3_GOSAR|nr:hypothetical protein PVK06_047135 [Gossypium arboreum]
MRRGAMENHRGSSVSVSKPCPYFDCDEEDGLRRLDENHLPPPLIILVTIARDLRFCIKCIEDSLFLDFGCGGFACGGKFGEIGVEGEVFQSNAHVSHSASQQL